MRAARSALHANACLGPRPPVPWLGLRVRRSAPSLNIPRGAPAGPQTTGWGREGRPAHPFRVSLFRGTARASRRVSPSPPPLPLPSPSLHRRPDPPVCTHNPKFTARKRRTREMGWKAEKDHAGRRDWRRGRYSGAPQPVTATAVLIFGACVGRATRPRACTASTAHGPGRADASPRSRAPLGPFRPTVYPAPHLPSQLNAGDQAGEASGGTSAILLENWCHH